MSAEPTIAQLQQQIAALQELVQTLQQREPAGPSQPLVASDAPVTSRQFKGLKMAPPDIFDGSTAKTEAFLSQLALFIHGKRHELYDDSDKVILALSYMKGGTAGSWAQGKVKAFGKTGVTPSWEDFMTEIREVFGDADPMGTAKFRMDQLSQGAMTCDEYVAKFRELVDDTGYNDAALVDKFEQGLNPGLVDKIYSLPEMPATLKDWIAWAGKLDRQWRHRQVRKKAQSTVATARPTPSSKAGPVSRVMNHHPPSQPVRPFQTSPPVASPRADPSAMEVDAGWKRVRPPLVCFKCRRPGHKAVDCRATVDIGLLDYDGLKAHMRAELMREEAASKEQQGDEGF